VGTNVRHVPFSQPPLLVLFQGIAGQQHTHSGGQVLDEAWRYEVKRRKVAQALMGTAYGLHTTRGQSRHYRAESNVPVAFAFA